jgi:hypothetical protein
MTLQQTVTIPADRRLHLDFDLPETASIGTATVILDFPTVPQSGPQPHRRPFEGLFGCTKDSGVWEGDGVEIIRKLRDEW